MLGARCSRPTFGQAINGLATRILFGSLKVHFLDFCLRSSSAVYSTVHLKVRHTDRWGSEHECLQTLAHEVATRSTTVLEKETSFQ